MFVRNKCYRSLRPCWNRTTLQMLSLNAEQPVQACATRPTKATASLQRALAFLCSFAHITFSLPYSTLASNQAAAIVQLFEWSWRDVALECEDFLGPSGYGAVQVSPPNEHIQGQAWWTRYQPVSYNLTSRSGSEEEFVSMIQKCAAAGVEVYADVVVNHMAAATHQTSAEGIGGSRFESRDFPLFAPEDFHHVNGDLTSNCLINDYSDRWNVQNCDLVALADLDTASPAVQGRIAAYISRLAGMGVAGARVDAAKHIPADDISAILQKAELPQDFFVYQEVIRGVGEPISPSEYLENGSVLEFGYPTEIYNHFMSDGELQYLKDVGEAWGLLPTERAVVFVDNHDLQRSGSGALSYKSGRLHELAQIFLLAHPYGTPRIMSSYYFEEASQGPPSTAVHSFPEAGKAGEVNCGSGKPWVCEHRWRVVAAMVGFRRIVEGEPLVDAQTLQDGNLLAFSRGDKGFVAINKGPAFHGWLDTGFPEGLYDDLLKEHGSKIKVNADGRAEVTLESMSAMAISAAGSNPPLSKGLNQTAYDAS